MVASIFNGAKNAITKAPGDAARWVKENGVDAGLAIGYGGAAVVSYNVGAIPLGIAFTGAAVGHAGEVGVKGGPQKTFKTMQKLGPAGALASVGIPNVF